MPGSPTPSGVSRSSGSDGLPFHRSPSTSDFQIERATKAVHRRSMPAPDAAYEDELVLRDSISRLLAAKDRIFSVSGRIPVDTSQLVLFFRSKVSYSHPLLCFPSCAD